MSNAAAPVREAVLDQWAKGGTASAIADTLGITTDSVRGIIAKARGSGDARAVHHQPGAVETWTADRIERLTALWSEGKTCAEIARALGDGTTRNAVIGKVHRLKLPARARKTAAPQTRRVTGVLIAARLRARAAIRAQQAALPWLPPDDPRQDQGGAIPTVAFRDAPAPALPPDARPVSLVERGERQCGFVISDPAGADTLMCGAPTAFAEAYCDYHTELAYLVPPPSWSASRRARFFAARARRLAAAAA